MIRASIPRIAYYLAHYHTDLSHHADAVIIQMLIDQVKAGGSIPDALTVKNAQDLYDRRYALAVQEAKKFVGVNWAGLPAAARTAVTDLAFNVGADKLAGFHHLQADLQAQRVDYVLAGFDLLNANRTTPKQVQYPRVPADYEYLVSAAVGRLGRVVGG